MLHHRYIVCFDVGVKSIIAKPVVFVLIVFEFSDLLISVSQYKRIHVASY